MCHFEKDFRIFKYIQNIVTQDDVMFLKVLKHEIQRRGLNSNGRRKTTIQ